MLSNRIAELVMDVMKAKKALNEALLKETNGEISLCSEDIPPQFYVEAEDLSLEDFCRKYAPLHCYSITSTDYHCTVRLPNGVKATVLLANNDNPEAEADENTEETEEV